MLLRAIFQEILDALATVIAKLSFRKPASYAKIVKQLVRGNLVNNALVKMQ